MPASASFIDFTKELFSPFGEIKVRKMFGGAGVYCDGLFFALIGDDDLWLKVDDETRAVFEAEALEPFTFVMKDGSSATMSYYALPEDAFDDHDVLEHWIRLGLQAAERAAAKKKPKKKKSKKKAPKKK